MTEDINIGEIMVKSKLTKVNENKFKISQCSTLQQIEKLKNIHIEYNNTIKNHYENENELKIKISKCSNFIQEIERIKYAHIKNLNTQIENLQNRQIEYDNMII